MSNGLEYIIMALLAIFVINLIRNRKKLISFILESIFARNVE